MAENEEKPLYQSKKLWIVVGAAILIGGVALGGQALGMSESLITVVITALGGLAAVLLGAHTYTDVTALSSGVTGSAQRNGLLREVLVMLSGIAGQLLGGVQPGPAVAESETESVDAESESSSDSE